MYTMEPFDNQKSLSQSSKLKEVIQRCTAWFPNVRYQSFEEILDILNEIVANPALFESESRTRDSCEVLVPRLKEESSATPKPGECNDGEVLVPQAKEESSATPKPGECNDEQNNHGYTTNF